MTNGITLTGNANINASLASSTLASDISASGAYTLTLIGGGANNLNITGNITNGSGTLALTVASGLQSLSGTNSFTARSTSRVARFSSSKLASYPTAGTIVTASGTTLGVNAGGTGEFADSDIANLLSHTTVGVVATAGSFSIDTTNAAAPVILTTTTLTDNGGKLSLIKAGANTLVVNSTGSYSGTTSVNAGTLALGASGNLGSTQVTVANGATFAVQQTASGTTNTIGNATQTLSAGGTLSMADGFTSTLAIAGGINVNGGTISLDVAGANTDKITGGSTIAVNGATVIKLNDTTNTALTPGTYNLITATTSAGSTLGTPSISLQSNTIVVNGVTYNVNLAASTNTTEKLTILAGLRQRHQRLLDRSSGSHLGSKQRWSV